MTKLTIHTAGEVCAVRADQRGGVDFAGSHMFQPQAERGGGTG